MRVSVKDAVNGNVSDPRNGVMLRMLSLIRYGERAGSGLQGIFKTWEKVYHSLPRIEMATDGVDRTTLYLDFNGRQPDIQAMLRLYDHPEEVKFEDSTQERKGESTQENADGTQENKESTQESTNSTQEPASSRDKLIALVKKNPNITLEEAASIIGITRDGVKKIVNRLKADGRLKREGSTKAGRWVILD